MGKTFQRLWRLQWPGRLLKVRQQQEKESHPAEGIFKWSRAVSRDLGSIQWHFFVSVPTRASAGLASKAAALGSSGWEHLPNYPGTLLQEMDRKGPSPWNVLAASITCSQCAVCVCVYTDMYAMLFVVCGKLGCSFWKQVNVFQICVFNPEFKLWLCLKMLICFKKGAGLCLWKHSFLRKVEYSQINIIWKHRIAWRGLSNSFSAQLTCTV